MLRINEVGTPSNRRWNKSRVISPGDTRAMVGNTGGMVGNARRSIVVSWTCCGALALALSPAASLEADLSTPRSGPLDTTRRTSGRHEAMPVDAAKRSLTSDRRR